MSAAFDAAVSPESLPVLVQELRRAVRERLSLPVKLLFDALDDSLFELAEHTHSGAMQQQYFDGMRECRRRRGELERRFIQDVEAALDLSGPDAAAAAAADSDLVLVENDELEAALAISAMVSRSVRQHARALSALTQRYGFMIGSPSLDEADNPLHPARLAELFRLLSGELQITLEVRLILFKLFERHVFGAIEALYSQLNMRLADAGVLPTLVPSLSSKVTTAPSAPQRNNRRHTEEPDEAPAGSPGLDPELLGALRELLSLRRLSDAPARSAGTARATPERVLQVLATLQQPASASRESTDAPLKQRLLARLGNDGSALALGRREEDTLDMIELLFDFVSSDSNLPGQIQPLLARLHLPLARAAVRNPDLLTEGNSAARQLIDEIARVALGWTANADPGGRLLTRIAETAAQVEQAADDEAAFTQALREFRSFTETQRRRADVAEQRAVDAALGRDRLRQARHRVTQALALRTTPHEPVAPWLRQLINRPWANFLVLLWLRHGEAHPAYAEALGFVEQLLWCATAGGGSDSLQHVLLRLPSLEAQLRLGLATVAYHENEIEQMAAELREFLHERASGRPDPGFVHRDPGVAVTPDFGHNGGGLEDQPHPHQLDDALLAQVRQLRPGTWFEFRPAEDQPERAKLSWISPISGRCLFVNRTGIKVAELAPEALATELEQGMARMLEGANLLQRALTAALDRLRPGNAQQRSSRSSTAPR